MSDSVWPHRRQPTRPRRPWESPGKNTGVGCHFLLQCMKVKSESEVAQSCPTLSDPMDGAALSKKRGPQPGSRQGTKFYKQPRWDGKQTLFQPNLTWDGSPTGTMMAASETFKQRTQLSCTQTSDQQKLREEVCAALSQ